LCVDVPKKPVKEYSAVTIDNLNEMIKNGISIGAHTQTHPILTRVKPEALGKEIIMCKHKLEEIVGTEVKTFCYPNGKPGDFNDFTIDMVKKAGYIGAVVSYIRIESNFNPYTIGRFGASNNFDEFLWKLYGGEFLAYKILHRTRNPNSSGK
jgi:peptidoglycan/xylan/chitin deacetylase (PgdA/CDA1 family)